MISQALREGESSYGMLIVLLSCNLKGKKEVQLTILVSIEFLFLAEKQTRSHLALLKEGYSDGVATRSCEGCCYKYI